MFKKVIFLFLISFIIAVAFYLKKHNSTTKEEHESEEQGVSHLNDRKLEVTTEKRDNSVKAESSFKQKDSLDNTNYEKERLSENLDYLPESLLRKYKFFKKRKFLGGYVRRLKDGSFKEIQVFETSYKHNIVRVETKVSLENGKKYTSNPQLMVGDHILAKPRSEDYVEELQNIAYDLGASIGDTRKISRIRYVHFDCQPITEGNDPFERVRQGLKEREDILITDPNYILSLH